MKSNMRVLGLPTPQSPAAWGSSTTIPRASCIPPARAQQCDRPPGGCRTGPHSATRSLETPRTGSPAQILPQGCRIALRPSHDSIPRDTQIQLTTAEPAPSIQDWLRRHTGPVSRSPPGIRTSPHVPGPARAQLLTLSPPPAPPASVAHRTDFVLEGAQRRGCPGWGMDQ